MSKEKCKCSGCDIVSATCLIKQVLVCPVCGMFILEQEIRIMNHKKKAHIDKTDMLEEEIRKGLEGI